MIGILSKESFEAYHSHSSKIKSIPKFNPNHEQCVATFNARSQNLLKSDIMELTLYVEDQTTGKKLGLRPRKGSSTRTTLNMFRLDFQRRLLMELTFLCWMVGHSFHLSGRTSISGTAHQKPQKRGGMHFLQLFHQS